jgi:hypothetical protein
MDFAAIELDGMGLKLGVIDKTSKTIQTIPPLPFCVEHTVSLPNLLGLKIPNTNPSNENNLPANIPRS